MVYFKVAIAKTMPYSLKLNRKLAIMDLKSIDIYKSIWFTDYLDLLYTYASKSEDLMFNTDIRYTRKSIRVTILKETKCAIQYYRNA